MSGSQDRYIGCDPDVITEAAVIAIEDDKVVIGEKIYVRDLYNEALSENENIDLLCKYVENYIKELEKYTHEEK